MLLTEDRAIVSARVLAEQAALGDKSKSHHKLWAVANASFETSIAHVDEFFRLLFQRCAAIPATPSHPRCQPVLLIRRRSYDFAKDSIVATRLVGGKNVADSMLSNKSLSSVFASEVEYIALLRFHTRLPRSAQWHMLKIPIPVHPFLSDRETADVTCELFDRLGISKDVEARADKVFCRSVDVSCHDDPWVNRKAEQADRLSHPKRGKLDIPCQAHKRVKVVGKTMSVSGGIDSRMIRLALSTKGTVHGDIVQEMQGCLVDSLVILNGRCPHLRANARRKQIYDMMFDPDHLPDVLHRSVAEQLFNGDIERTDRVEHWENGCCSSPAETLHLMQTHGVAALYGCKTVPLSRKSWMGGRKAFRNVGRSIHVHALWYH